MSTHQAALLPAAGSRFTLASRPTTPGPGELLIAVHAVALNPIDHYMRDAGFALSIYPAVIGSDIAGVVLAAGPPSPAPTSTSTPTASPTATSTTTTPARVVPQVGDRVAAFAPTFFAKGAPDYGALQARVLVRAASATILPSSISFTEAALLPMAVGTAWCAWRILRLPRTPFPPPAPDAAPKGLLVWGGASSIGSAAIQLARSQGFRVYATASARHHAYLRGLGAEGGVWEYRDPEAVAKVVAQAKRDGVAIDVGFDSVGAWKEPMAVLREARTEGAVARLASARPLSGETPTVEGVEVNFIETPEAEEWRELVGWVFNAWLRERLADGSFVPSPHVRVVDGGLGAADEALDVLKAGVSGQKLVLEVE